MTHELLSVVQRTPHDPAYADCSCGQTFEGATRASVHLAFDVHLPEDDDLDRCANGCVCDRYGHCPTCPLGCAEDHLTPCDHGEGCRGADLF